MKPATFAPAFACLYPGLCDVAQKLGYALSIHGSVSRDLDLVAIPWINEAVDEEVLVKAIIDHTHACLYPDLLRRNGRLSEDQIKQVCSRAENVSPQEKPHGRRSWSLHLDFSAYIDLSVMPKQENTNIGARTQ
jgi:hypothetical protein